jgi:hypothetical protein
MTDELKRTQRGFRIYAEGEDAYDKKYAVVESSSVEPGIWIQPNLDSGEVRDSANLLFSPDDLIDFGKALIKAGKEKRKQG